MISYLLAILGLVALCAGWVLFQVWMKQTDPGYRGLRGGCGGCRESGSCRKECRPD